MIDPTPYACLCEELGVTSSSGTLARYQGGVRPVMA